jgi:hypothetical protein
MLPCQEELVGSSLQNALSAAISGKGFNLTTQSSWAPFYQVSLVLMHRSTTAPPIPPLPLPAPQVHSSEEEALLQRRRFYALACQVCAGRLLARVPLPPGDRPLNNRQQRFFSKTVASLLRWPTRALEKLFVILYQHRRAGSPLGRTLDSSLIHHVADAVAADTAQGVLPSGPASLVGPCGRVVRGLYAMLGPSVSPRPDSLALRAEAAAAGQQISTSVSQAPSTRSRAAPAPASAAAGQPRGQAGARKQQPERVSLSDITTVIAPELSHLFEQVGGRSGAADGDTTCTWRHCNACTCYPILTQALLIL